MRISVDLKLFLGPRQRIFFARPSGLLCCFGNNNYEAIFLNIYLSSLPFNYLNIIVNLNSDQEALAIAGTVAIILVYCDITLLKNCIFTVPLNRLILTSLFVIVYFKSYVLDICLRR